VEKKSVQIRHIKNKLMNGLQLITAPTTLVAFSVALQHSINLGQDQPVEFDKVVTNIGNKPVYKGHPGVLENVVFMSSCPLNTG
jgi:NADH dehydrogenase FAD-containing subunit